MDQNKYNALLVLQNGEKMHRMAMPLVVLLLIALPLLLIVCAVFFVIGDAQYLPLYFALCGYYDVLNGVFALCYCLVALGILALPFYLTGLHLIGVGQIALNTLKENPAVPFEPMPDYEPADPFLNYEPTAPVQPVYAPPVQEFVPPQQPAPVYEQEFVSAQQSQPAHTPPQPTYEPPKPAAPKCSKTLYNGLRKAAETTDDRDMVDILERTAAKLSVESERKLIRQLMNCPSSRLRQVVERVYGEISGTNE